MDFLINEFIKRGFVNDYINEKLMWACEFAFSDIAIDLINNNNCDLSLVDKS